MWTDFIHSAALKLYKDGDFDGSLNPDADIETCRDQWLKGTLEDGLPEGYCELRYSHPASYVGFLKQGKREGPGILTVDGEYEVSANWHADRVSEWFVYQSDSILAWGSPEQFNSVKFG